MEERRLDTPTDHPKWYVALEDVPTKVYPSFIKKRLQGIFLWLGLGCFCLQWGVEFYLQTTKPYSIKRTMVAIKHHYFIEG